MKKLILFCQYFVVSFICDAQTISPLDNYMLGQMNDLKLPGVGIAIVKDNKLALAKGYGYADIERDIPYTPNTIQEIASISKPVTATAAWQLWEDGYFQLDQAIDGFLPFTVRNPNFPNVPITFRMLMNHTSSIVKSVGFNPPGASMPLGLYLQNFLSPGGSLYNASESYRNFAPGTQYQYSNIAYGLLGYLVERISGIPFNEYCNQHIYQPLCMNNTRWYYSELDTNIVARPYKKITPNGELDLYEMPDYPGGGLKTSVVDLSRFFLMHGNYGILDGVRIIDSTTELMMRHQESFIRGDSNFVEYEGLGWQTVHDFIINKDFFGKGGDHPGVSTRAYFNITDNAAVMVFSNGRNDVSSILMYLDQNVKDTVSTTGKPNLDCSYQFNPCEQNADYWKNHQPEWAINSVPMKLGTNHYYNANELIALLNSPDNGDASIVLAKALITAKFNIARGSELEPIVLTVNASMSLIDNHWVHYNNPVSFSSATGIQMLALAATLDSYNSGSLNTTPCSGVLARITNPNRTIETKNLSTAHSLSVFPNPSSGNFTISFTVPVNENISLAIYDLQGRLAKAFIKEDYHTGSHNLIWDATNMNPGVYTLKLQSENSVETRKLILIK